MANISARVSIRWLPSPPSEPTSTIVTTTPRLKYLDLRLPASLDDSLPPYCAIAGKTVVGTPMRWVHEIDSRTDTPGEDSGVNTPLPNGNILEKGRMVDDEDGRTKDYEEIWRNVEIEENVAVMLECDDSDARGRVIRVGEYCQGMIKVGGRTSCERFVKGAEGGGWKRVYCHGDVRVPSGIVCLDQDSLDKSLLEDGLEGNSGGFLTSRGVNVGDTYRYAGYTWRVTEKSEW